MKIISFLMALLLNVNATPRTPENVIVDKIEDNNIAVVEVYYNNKTNIVDIPQDDFNTPVNEGDRLEYSIAKGKVTNEIKDVDGNTYYQFKSYDNNVWWSFSEKELGFTPALNGDYVVLYYDNGTTAQKKPCDCSPELECECEVYDDIFLGLFGMEVK